MPPAHKRRRDETYVPPDDDEISTESSSDETPSSSETSSLEESTSSEELRSSGSEESSGAEMSSSGSEEFSGSDGRSSGSEEFSGAEESSSGSLEEDEDEDEDEEESSGAEESSSGSQEDEDEDEEESSGAEESSSGSQEDSGSESESETNFNNIMKKLEYESGKVKDHVREVMALNINGGKLGSPRQIFIAANQLRTIVLHDADSKSSVFRGLLTSPGVFDSEVDAATPLLIASCCKSSFLNSVVAAVRRANGLLDRDAHSIAALNVPELSVLFLHYLAHRMPIGKRAELRRIANRLHNDLAIQVGAMAPEGGGGGAAGARSEDDLVHDACMEQIRLLLVSGEEGFLARNVLGATYLFLTKVFELGLLTPAQVSGLAFALIYLFL